MECVAAGWLAKVGVRLIAMQARRLNPWRKLERSVGCSVERTDDEARR